MVRHSKIINSDKDSLGSAETSALKEVISNQKVLISDETLIDWNPRNWEASANRLLELFGPHAKIVVSIREPIGYLSSLYLQKLQEGHIIRAEEFFVSSEEYKKILVGVTQGSILSYDYEKFDYAYLKSLYKKRFKNVYFMPFSRINSLYSFDELFLLSESDVKKYSEAFKKAPKESRSYSELAVRLAFLRQIFVNILGIKSLGSEHIYYENEGVSPPQDSHKLRGSINFEGLCQINKMRDLLSRLTREIIKPWRWYMQSFVDRLYPYKKYKLPKEALVKFESSLMK